MGEAEKMPSCIQLLIAIRFGMRSGRVNSITAPDERQCHVGMTVSTLDALDCLCEMNRYSNWTIKILVTQVRIIVTTI